MVQPRRRCAGRCSAGRGGSVVRVRARGGAGGRVAGRASGGHLCRHAGGCVLRRDDLNRRITPFLNGPIARILMRRIAGRRTSLVADGAEQRHGGVGIQDAARRRARLPVQGPRAHGMLELHTSVLTMRRRWWPRAARASCQRCASRAAPTTAKPFSRCCWPGALSDRAHTTAPRGNHRVQRAGRQQHVCGGWSGQGRRGADERHGGAAASQVPATRRHGSTGLASRHGDVLCAGGAGAARACARRIGLSAQRAGRQLHALGATARRGLCVTERSAGTTSWASLRA